MRSDLARPKWTGCLLTLLAADEGAIDGSLRSHQSERSQLNVGVRRASAYITTCWLDPRGDVVSTSLTNIFFLRLVTSSRRATCAARSRAGPIEIAIESLGEPRHGLPRQVAVSTCAGAGRARAGPTAVDGLPPNVACS